MKSGKILDGDNLRRGGGEKLLKLGDLVLGCCGFSFRSKPRVDRVPSGLRRW